MEKSKFYMLVGLSGSGKSFYNFKEEIIKISSDALRAELYGDENDQTYNSEIFNELHKRVIKHLKNGNNVVYDATNLSARRRKAFLKTISHIDCEKTCIVFATPFEECVERDLLRERTVGRRIIFKQMKQFQMPQFEEGWDFIDVETVEENKKIHLSDLLHKAYSIKHDNPHHLETIGEHLTMTYSFAVQNEEPLYLMTAALYHDIGKIYTKGFYNSKGEKSDIAHFYQHERVSAYLYLTSHQFMLNPYCLRIIWLIENHMRPYFDGYEKWKSTQNSEWVKDLGILHLADQKARIIE